RCYQQGGFAGRIDYRREPPVPLNDEKRSWLSLLLTVTEERAGGGRAGFEPPTFLHERIARVAYSIWQAEGCPSGRDKEHWYGALEQLRREAGRGPQGT